VMWWLLPTARARLARAIGATIAVAAVTGAVLGTRLAAVLGERVTSLASAAHNPYDHRGELWAAGVRVALEHPWLGVGPGRFGVVASDGGHSLYRYVADHPHNLVLTVAAETGAYGLATTGLFALLLLATVAAQRRRCAIGGSGALPAALAGPAAGLAAVAVHGLVDVPLRNPIVESTVWLVLAALVVTTAPSPLPSSSFPSAARTRPHPTRRSA
jgi:putative inorganic carbon (HCO3(-)) transporter